MLSKESCIRTNSIKMLSPYQWPEHRGDIAAASSHEPHKGVISIEPVTGASNRRK